MGDAGAEGARKGARRNGLSLNSGMDSRKKAQKAQKGSEESGPQAMLRIPGSFPIRVSRIIQARIGQSSILVPFAPLCGPGHFPVPLTDARRLRWVRLGAGPALVRLAR